MEKQYFIDSAGVARLLGISQSTLTYRVQKGLFIAPTIRSSKNSWFVPDIIRFYEDEVKKTVAPFKKYYEPGRDHDE